MTYLTELSEAIPQGKPGEQISIKIYDGTFTSDLDSSQLIGIYSECVDRYKQAVKVIEKSLGAPNYMVSYDDESFPDWCTGVKVAVWKTSDGITYLSLSNHDPDLDTHIRYGCR